MLKSLKMESSGSDDDVQFVGETKQEDNPFLRNGDQKLPVFKKHGKSF